MHHSRTELPSFLIIWIGQAVSLLGSAMTWFALSIWAYERTGQATALAMIAALAYGPTVLLSPIAGALVDRYDRRLLMILADLTAGLSTAFVLILYITVSLEIWHVYLVGLVAGTFQALQYPAYSAAITTMLPREHYARASGMMELAGAASGILAPLLAGILLGWIGLVGIMSIDLVSFVLAVGSLLIVRIPKPQVTGAGRQGQGNLVQESLYGFRYIVRRPSLLALQVLFAAGNLVDYMGFTLFAPMILARTGGNELVLGSVQSAGALGGFVGGLILSIWGGPKRRIHGVLVGWGLASLAMVLMGIGQVLPIWLGASFAFAFFEPIINGSDQAIWQTKVAPDVQGRVFASQMLISHVTMPVGMLLAGPLADHLFEPAMMPGQPLANLFGNLVGVGPGAGMGLLVVISGTLSGLLPVAGYALRAIRDVERILPDHDAALLELPL
jgi:MFS family permease